MNKAIIIHCWGGSSNHCWYPESKKELEQEGFEVQIPNMPDTDNPQLKNWLPKLKEVADPPNENLFLIGHSLGGITILRYLEQLDENQKIAGVVFISACINALGYPEIENFFEKPINFEKIKTKAEYFVIIHSEDDPIVPVKHAHQFKKTLDGVLIIKSGLGHCTGPIGEAGSVEKLSDVSESLLQMSNV